MAIDLKTAKVYMLVVDEGSIDALEGIAKRQDERVIDTLSMFINEGLAAEKMRHTDRILWTFMECDDYAWMMGHISRGHMAAYVLPK